ncbi:MAG: hypothetical protein ABIW03_02360 [Sphingomicrobium sp.]
MRWKLGLLALIFAPTGAGAATQLAPLKNPAVLNIGFVCRWDDRCIGRQKDAMRHSLKYVAKYPPPAWKIQLCNRNAGRNGTRVDWVGFHNCVRNPQLRPPPPKPRKRRS